MELLFFSYLGLLAFALFRNYIKSITYIKCIYIQNLQGLKQMSRKN